LPTASSLTTSKNNLLKFLQVVLFPAEGEGRNVCGTQGWNVHAFDQSIQGKKESATQADVAINYEVGEFQ
jgi:hypothetical protein